jgi:hypothetical protein
MKKLALMSLIISIVLLAGCTKTSNNSVEIDQTPTGNLSDTTTSTKEEAKSTTFTPSSSGDVDKDIQEIEDAINSLDVDEDFPTFNSEDI